MLMYGRHLSINTKFTRITQIELIQDNSNRCWPFSRQLDRLDDKSDEERPNHQNQSTARELFRILKLLSWAEAGVRGKSFFPFVFSTCSETHWVRESRCLRLPILAQTAAACRKVIDCYLLIQRQYPKNTATPLPLSISLARSIVSQAHFLPLKKRSIVCHIYTRSCRAY